MERTSRLKFGKDNNHRPLSKPQSNANSRNIRKYDVNDNQGETMQNVGSFNSSTE